MTPSWQNNVIEPYFFDIPLENNFVCVEFVASEYSYPLPNVSKRMLLCVNSLTVILLNITDVIVVM